MPGYVLFYFYHAEWRIYIKQNYVHMYYMSNFAEARKPFLQFMFINLNSFACISTSHKYVHAHALMQFIFTAIPSWLFLKATFFRVFFFFFFCVIKRYFKKINSHFF